MATTSSLGATAGAFVTHDDQRVVYWSACAEREFGGG